MASYVSGSHTYGLAAAQTDLPPSFGSSTLPRPIPSSVQLQNLASQSGDQTSGGMIAFQVPTGASASGYLKNNSVYLRCRVTLNGTITADSSFQMSSKSASSIINKLTCTINGVVVSQINNYHLLHEMLITHATTKGYYDTDNAILQQGNTDCFAANAQNPFVDVIIPLICPLFTADKAVPLFLLNAPIQLNLDLNNTATAFKHTGATGFTVSRAQLIYELINVDSNYIQDVKSALSAGNAYQMNLHDFYTANAANQATLNYQMGGNWSSVRGALYVYTANPVNTAITALANDTQTDFQFFIDGRQAHNFTIDNKAVQFAEMNRALGNMFDPVITSNCTAANYVTDKYAGGICTNRVSDVMAMTGSPAQNVQFVIRNTGTAGAVYFYLLYDQVLTIDVNGSILLIK